MNVGILNAPINDVVLAAYQPRPSCLLWQLGEAKRCSAVDGAEHLNIPRLLIVRKHDRRRWDDTAAQFLQRQKQVLTALLPPPLLEIVEHVPGGGAFHLAVDVVPRLPGAASPDVGALVVCLMEVLSVNCVESSEEGVRLSVVSAIAEIDPAYEAHNPPPRVVISTRHAAVSQEYLLVMCKHCIDLQPLDDAVAVVRIARAQHAVNPGVAEEASSIFIVSSHQSIILEQLHRSSLIPHQHQHPHTFTGLLDQQLAKGTHHVSAVSHQRDLRVNRPASDVNQVLGVGNRIENIHPTPIRAVKPPAGERDLGAESISHVSILVQSESAGLPLREEGEGDAGEVGAFEAARPAALARDVVEVELDVERGVAVDGVGAAVEDWEPGVDFVAA